MSYIPEPEPPPLIPPNWRPRFTIKRIFALTTVCCVLFAIWQGLLRGVDAANVTSAMEAKFWVVILVTLPMLLMIIAGLIEPCRRIYAKLRRR